MKSKIIQKKGQIINLFLVFIIISYTKLEEVNGSKNYVVKGEDKIKKFRGEGMKIKTLKRVSQLLLKSYFLFNVQFILNSADINQNISLKDGKIKITEGRQLLNILILVISGLIIKNQKNYNKLKDKGGKKEKYIILLTNLQGISLLINSNDWILTIISWELFNMSQYLLVSLNSESESSQAAALKYFVLSALSTAFLLKGVCLLYYKTGSTNYEIIETSIRELVRGGNNEINKIELGKVLILFTLLFKLSAAPFYQWAPDLYENLETKVTKWMIVIPKLTVLSFLLLLTTDFSIYLELRSVELILLITGSLSLIVGSIALNNQWYIKRFLAYSGISHVGFKLLALYSLETQGFIFYKITYGITTINIFAILIILSEFKGRDIKKIKDQSGIFKLNPKLSLAQALNLFSLAGVCLLNILRKTRKM